MLISIIEFSVENFKVFKKKVTFSMSARKSEHTFESNGQNLLKTSLIYGPNASGKSTLFNALSIVKNGVLDSSRNPEGASLPYIPFILSSDKNKPSFFEIVFSLEEKIFRYNFSIIKDRIITENLFEILSSGKEKKYLIRREQDIKLFSDFEKEEDIKVKTRKEALFLSAASQWNNKLAMKIEEGFKNINVISGSKTENYQGFTEKMLDEIDKKSKIINYLQKADFCIEDIEKAKVSIPENIKKTLINFKDIPEFADTLFFSHGKYENNERIGSEKINIGNESAGTSNFFNKIGPIIDTIENGKVLFIDELDNSLHPYLTKFIIDLFEKNNPKNAQLIVTTHDTSLLSYKEDFIKDQFWFTEKDKFGTGNLISLSEFDLRNDTEFSKKYLEGRFGSVPFISSL
jgi:AAA15 family ATPase/GTPase